MKTITATKGNTKITSFREDEEVDECVSNYQEDGYVVEVRDMTEEENVMVGLKEEQIWKK
jgi:hypothetical protein